VKKKITKIYFFAGNSKQAKAAKTKLLKKYKQTEVEKAEVIVALGGDGTMLETLHKFIDKKVPIYGMNCGSVGFLMNNFSTDKLTKRIQLAKKTILHPLHMKAKTIDNKKISALAVNEVSLLRESRQSAKLRILVNNSVKLSKLVCDGVLLSTPAGSSAYNFSAHGPIIPLQSSILSLTPISAFRPRRWRGALLPTSSIIKIQVLEKTKRPVSAVADFTEVRDVDEVEIQENKKITLTLLFDPNHNLEERIINEQFAP
jgi:NAD+ kinase